MELVLPRLLLLMSEVLLRDADGTVKAALFDQVELGNGVSSSVAGSSKHILDPYQSEEVCVARSGVVAVAITEVHVKLSLSRKLRSFRRLYGA